MFDLYFKREGQRGNATDGWSRHCVSRSPKCLDTYYCGDCGNFFLWC
jgi:hypothetical protein